MKTAWEQFPFTSDVKEILETKVSPYEAGRVCTYVNTLLAEVDRLNDESGNQKVVMDLLIQKIKERKS